MTETPSVPFRRESAPYSCPKCGGVSIEETLTGSYVDEHGFDDGNRAVCANQECRHRGTVGDWQRCHTMRIRMSQLIRKCMELEHREMVLSSAVSRTVKNQ